MSADDWFMTMVVCSLPAANLYPIVYATQTRWWVDWIGIALLTKAVGLAILLDFTAAFLVFGPEYPYRDVIRNTGMAVVTVGLYMGFGAMMRALFQRKGTAMTNKHDERGTT